MNEYWMEIVGKILLFGGVFVAVLSEISISALAYKIRYHAGLSFLIVPTIALVRKDLWKDNKVLIFLGLWGASLPMVVLGAFVLAVA
jgi:hypothetical protein